MTAKRLFNRRQFMETLVPATTAALASPALLARSPLAQRQVRMGVVGGNFGSSFYFHEHPQCIVEAVSDLVSTRRERLMKTYQCAKSYESLEKLLTDKKIEAVFIATPAPDHVRHVIATLRAGKHVLCAVPAAMTLEECGQLKDAVERSGLIYMMAETSVYRQQTISARELYTAGKFGNMFSAAAEYNHPGLEVLFFENGKPTWRHGLPPMLYPTHCTSFLISVTGERLNRVSALGWGDGSDILKNNQYKNPFWNETAFFTTNRDMPFRVEVNWRGALVEAERGEWRGDKMSFYLPAPGSRHSTVVSVGDKTSHDDAGFKYAQNIVREFEDYLWWKTEALPAALRHDSGHGGSHTFITHKFIDAIVRETQPEINVYEALAYTAPGIVAHQSALNRGESLPIPSFDK